MNKALLAFLLWPVLAVAKPWWLTGSKASEVDFLPPDAAFRISSVVDGNLIRVRWVIADGYYLYRAKFDIKPESPDLILETPVFPSGVSRTDEYFGTQEIYKQEVEGIVGFKRGDAGAHPPQIRVTYQGCAEAGLCYPPLVKVLNPQVSEAAPPTSVMATAAPTRTPNDAVLFGILGGSLAFFLAGAHLRRKLNPTAL